MTNSSSITLIGRASQLDPKQNSFVLTVKGRGQQPELVVECQAKDQLKIKSFEGENITEGSLVGVIGTMKRVANHEYPIVVLSCLEILGKPLGEAR